jgi:hypothetical protein
MAIADTTGANFDIARVASRTFGLIGRNLVPFGVLSLIFAGVPNILIMLVQPSLLQGDPSKFGGVILGVTLISGLASLVLSAALTRASVDDLSGKGANIGAALGTGASVLLPMIGLGLLMGIAIVFGLILLFVPGVYLFLMWIAAAPALVVERVGITKAMERSAFLTQNHRWAILGLIVLYIIVVVVFELVIAALIPGAMGSMVAPTGEGPSILVIALLTLVQVVTSMVGTVGIASIYFELRQIKEGVGVTELANVFA